MRVYSEQEDAVREKRIIELQEHFSERLNGNYTRDDVISLLVWTYYSENEEAIRLSNRN